MNEVIRIEQPYGFEAAFIISERGNELSSFTGSLGNCLIYLGLTINDGSQKRS